MTGAAEQLTIGVEEEYQIIDPLTRELQNHVQRILPQAQRELEEAVQPELKQSQIEITTPICQTLAEVRSELVRLRHELIIAAAASGSRIVAAGTHPFSHWADQPLTPKTRYKEIAGQYGQLAEELVIFGCHVHVGVPDRAIALEVMNRARPWLASLLALAANSPFWLGEDTGYASFRSELWGRWPMAGPPQPFASRDEYEALVEALINSGSIEDASKIYWDVRLPQRFETIEFRVTDVCLRVDEAVMIAGLVRGLVQRCIELARAHVPYQVARPELIRAAHWRAARYGLERELLDVEAARAVPARQHIEALLTFVRPSLESNGDWSEIRELVEETLRRGNGATRQRLVYERSGRLEDVVDFMIEETVQGVLPA